MDLYRYMRMSCGFGFGVGSSIWDDEFVLGVGELSLEAKELLLWKASVTTKRTRDYLTTI